MVRDNDTLSNLLEALLTSDGQQSVVLWGEYEHNTISSLLHISLSLAVECFFSVTFIWTLMLWSKTVTKCDIDVVTAGEQIQCCLL